MCDSRAISSAVSATAGVEAAVANDHNAGNWRIAAFADELLQGVAQAGIVAAENQLFLPRAARWAGSA